MQRERASSTLRIANIGKLPGKTKTPDTTLLVSSEWEQKPAQTTICHQIDCYMLDGWIKEFAYNLVAHQLTSAHWAMCPNSPPHWNWAEDQSAKPFELVRFHPEPSAHLHRPSSWQIRWGCVFGGRLRLSGASSLMLIKGTGGNLQDAYAINMKQQVNDTGGRTFWLSFWVHPLYSNAMSICRVGPHLRRFPGSCTRNRMMGSKGYITSLLLSY